MHNFTYDFCEVFELYISFTVLDVAIVIPKINKRIIITNNELRPVIVASVKTLLPAENSLIINI